MCFISQLYKNSIFIKLSRTVLIHCLKADDLSLRGFALLEILALYTSSQHNEQLSILIL